MPIEVLDSLASVASESGSGSFADGTPRQVASDMTSHDIYVISFNHLQSLTPTAL